MGVFNVEPEQVPGSSWWRRDTPTVVDGVVVRYTECKDVRRNEISASRNGIYMKWNGFIADPGEFVDVLGWATAQVPVLRATGEPMPLGCEQHPARQAESETV